MRGQGSFLQGETSGNGDVTKLSSPSTPVATPQLKQA
jgi:hypothetical protein